MSSRHILLLALFVTTIAIVLAVSTKPKNVIVGSRYKGDHLIQREFLKVPSKTLQTVKDKKTYSGNRRSRITQVKLLDQNKNGNGASASIVNGGPGSNYVTVDFRSVKGHSINYIIELYGR